MTTQIETAEEFIALEDMDAWAAFWADNEEGLADTIGDEVTCLALAMNCCLIIGGGAAPIFRVGFVD